MALLWWLLKVVWAVLAVWRAMHQPPTQPHGVGGYVVGVMDIIAVGSSRQH
ncbi:hypothetical protein [Moraxella marmotae]|uniref:hypothetical protein n=1 Tax=Moraxella marmotae TaxID=3344520 RepID=UPI0035F4C3D1